MFLKTYAQGIHTIMLNEKNSIFFKVVYIKYDLNFTKEKPEGLNKNMKV